MIYGKASNDRTIPYSLGTYLSNKLNNRQLFSQDEDLTGSISMGLNWKGLAIR